MQQYLYIILALALFGAAGFGWWYYTDFFAAETHPSEWWMLYLGLAVSGIAVLAEAGSIMTGFDLQNATLIARLTGAGLVLVAGFVFWHKFRL